ncbi:hypothetical protein BGX38DRAFT_1159990 [Terfezia claveryi]|nr:hypothetical protein BGX38DRAFT_1159990 [Terfezia claveryi]
MHIKPPSSYYLLLPPLNGIPPQWKHTHSNFLFTPPADERAYTTFRHLGHTHAHSLLLNLYSSSWVPASQSPIPRRIRHAHFSSPSGHRHQISHSAIHPISSFHIASPCCSLLPFASLAHFVPLPPFNSISTHTILRVGPIPIQNPTFCVEDFFSLAFRRSFALSNSDLIYYT